MAGGRPTDYREEYNELAYKYCLLGATDKQLAEYFEVSEATINNWKKEYPQFLESIMNGREKADAEIAASLYHRAKGYSHPDVHVSNYQGVVTLTELTKHYPPDTQAASLWLRNRQKDRWRDKQEMEHSGKDGGPIQVDDVGNNEVARRLAFLLTGGTKDT